MFLLAFFMMVCSHRVMRMQSSRLTLAVLAALVVGSGAFASQPSRVVLLDFTAQPVSQLRAEPSATSRGLADQLRQDFGDLGTNAAVPDTSGTSPILVFDQGVGAAFVQRMVLVAPFLADHSGTDPRRGLVESWRSSEV